MQVCSYILKSNKILAYFPEGQRTPGGKITAFKKGIGILAGELPIPLIPLYIDGAHKAWPTYRLLPRPCRVTVRIGKKLTAADLKPSPGIKPDEEYEALAENLRQELIRITQS